MIAAQVAVDARGARDRSGCALIQSDLNIEHAGRDKPIEMTVAVFEPVDIFCDIFAQRLERVAQPRLWMQIAAKAAGLQQAAEKAASGELAVDLLGAFLQELALCFPHLERRCVTEMAEVVQVVVQALQLRKKAT